MKYNGFYFWMFKGTMKKVLAEKYGKAYAAEIMKKSKKVYRELVDKADDIGDDNPMAYNELFALAFLSLYEHQSTYCPNMPLRDLIYYTEMIQKKIDRQKRDIYGKRLLKIPAPHFVVFYNGKENAPEHYELRLSDAFEHETGQPELELVCQVNNINKGKNAELLSKCPTLRDYMYFVDLVRQYDHDPDVYNLEKAIQLAIDQCIREDVLKEFLQERGKEVMNVMTLDFSFERRLELQRAEAAEEGEKIGIHKILSEQIRKKLLKNKSLEQIADELEETSIQSSCVSAFFS